MSKYEVKLWLLKLFLSGYRRSAHEQAEHGWVCQRLERQYLRGAKNKLGQLEKTWFIKIFLIYAHSFGVNGCFKINELVDMLKNCQKNEFFWIAKRRKTCFTFVLSCILHIDFDGPVSREGSFPETWYILFLIFYILFYLFLLFF